MPLIGPAIAPVFGGLIAEYSTWRCVLTSFVVLAGSVLISSLLQVGVLVDEHCGCRDSVYGIVFPRRECVNSILASRQLAEAGHFFSHFQRTVPSCWSERLASFDESWVFQPMTTPASRPRSRKARQPTGLTWLAKRSSDPLPSSSGSPSSVSILHWILGWPI